MRGKKTAKLTKVAVRLPFGLGEAEWEADDSQRRTAWELYVELATRVSVVSLGANAGMIREAMTSLHELFGVTRSILRSAGPGVGAAPESTGVIAMTVLNIGIRPFLSRWHPELSAWESSRDLATSPRDHELAWSKNVQVREDLVLLQKELMKYAMALAAIAGADPSVVTGQN